MLPAGEVRLTFGQLANRIASRPPKRTVARWATEGLKHPGDRHVLLVLESTREGGRRYTSWEAWERFETLLNGPVEAARRAMRLAA